MPADLELYDTYQRKVRRFETLDGGDEVRLYACGPTVYDYAHIGNLRTYLFEDTLRRALEFHGYRVRHVVNITDVGHLTSDADVGEDKVEQGAKREGLSAWDIADRYTRAFQADWRRLNMRAPTLWCRATDHIDEQIADIAEIERRGFTYRTADGVYFDTSKLPDYGRLARLDAAGLAAGARVDVGEKRNATDFALWKFSPPDSARQMEWASPWGRGFPGWHIECSAMAAKYLGAQFDIHCGGKDHIPVHHCNEIAQSQARHGTTLANFWLHGYFLQVDQSRMSKSSGEFLRLDALVERGYDPLAYRYLCLTAHYRSDMKFSWRSLDGAAAALQRLRAAVNSCGDAGGDVEPDAAAVEAFRAEIARDLNTPRALAVVWSTVKGDLPAAVKRATLLRFDAVLGLEVERAPATVAEAIPAAVSALAAERDAARAERDWAAADRLRAAIESHGFAVEDGPEGSQLRRR